ncbi:MAG: protein kinase [Dermatophilaceae bacterium]
MSGAEPGVEPTGSLGPPQLPGLDYVQPLGSGGYAEVYLYEQRSPRMPVAVKVLKAAGLTDALRTEFLAEADTMAALGDHPHIVPVFGSGTAPDGRPYLVMKYYPGPNLAQRTRAEPFAVADVLRTGVHLASAVQTAHNAHVIHRDIKPANVLVSAYGAAGLTDFGVAGRGAQPGATAGPPTRADVGVSVPWSAPEVVFATSDGDERSDIYSLGATLWQMLTGRSPFEVPGGDNTAYALMQRVRSMPVPSTGRPDVPAALERLLAQTMAKDPARRPGTALELARALQTVEQQLHLAPTRVVVLDAVHPPATAPVPPPATAADERTHVKGARPIPAQPPVAPAAGMPPGSPPAAEATPPVESSSDPPGSATAAPSPTADATAASSPTADATAASSPTADATAARPVRVDPRVVPDARGEGTQPSRTAGLRGWRLGAPVAVLALVVAGVVLARRAPVPPPAPAPVTLAPSDSSAIGDGVFAPPTVTATPIPGGVRFAWTYDDPAARDSARVRVAADPAAAAVAAPVLVQAARHEAPAAPGSGVCAVVSVVRAGQLSPPSAPVCAVAG